MAGEHIDEAFVDIKPDVKDFSKDLNAELTAAFKSVERKLDDVVDDIEHEFKKLTATLDIHFEHLVTTIDDAFDSIKNDARGAGRAIATDIEAGTAIAKHAIDDLADDAGRDFARLRRKSHDDGVNTGRGFLRGIFDALQGAGNQLSGAIGNAFSGAGGAIGSIFGGGGDIVGGLKIAAIASLIPIVIALAGALSQLLGLLLLIPGAIGVLVAAIAPLIIAFQGMGEAIGAGLSGDTKKFNEALKGLAPNARKVVKEIVALKSVFSEIKRSVQDAFFGPLVGSFKQLSTTLLPALTVGLTQVSAALGRFVRGFLDILSTPTAVHALNELFATTSRIFDNLGPAAAFFFETMFKLIQAGLPFIERMADSFAVALVRFTDFLANAANGGKFTEWVENAFRVVSELWDLLKAVGGLLKTLFVGTAASGEDFITSLTEMINKLNDFFSNTKEGKETIVVLAKTVEFLADVVIGLGVSIANILRWGNEFTHWLIDAWNWVKSVGSAIGDFFVGVGNALVGAWNAITGFISSAWNSVVSFFTQLPGRISMTLSALPGILRNAAVAAFDQFFFAIGFGIGTVIAFFRDLPGRIWAILQELWATAQTIVSTGVNAVVNFFSSLPSRVGNFVNTMKLRVITLIVETKNAFVARVSELVSSATSAISSLPGKIWAVVKDLPSRFFSLGRDMILGMADGIKSFAGQLVDAAKRAAHDAWEGAKKAIGANSPSKEFAKLGKWSVQGFEQGMNDESDDASRRTPGFPPDVFSGRGSGAMSEVKTAQSGGTQVIAYLQIGDDQLHPVVVRAIEDNPQTVALANERGTTKLDRRR